MAAGLVALLGGGARQRSARPRSLGAVLAAPGWVALRLIIGIVEVAAGIPFGSVAFEPAVGAALGVATVPAWRQLAGDRRSPAATAAREPAAVRRRRARRARTRSRAHAGTAASLASRLATMSLVVAVAVAGAVVVTRPAGVARITVLDVGQGDAILIEGLARRPAAHRRRPRSRPAAGRARSADPAVGPADRRGRPVASARGPRRRAGPAARPVPRRTASSSPGCAGPGPGYAAWLDRPGQARGAGPAVDRRG